jgi:hypothetical protein
MRASQVIAAIRDGWLLDTVPAHDADFDMSVSEYINFRKRGAPLAVLASSLSEHWSSDEGYASVNASGVSSRAGTPKRRCVYMYVCM